MTAARPMLAAASAGAALAIAACGSHGASRADVIARANAICSTAQRRIRDVAAPSGSSLPALSTYLHSVLPVIDAETTALGALPRPARRRPELEAFETAQRATAGDYRALATAAGRGDQGAVDRALAALQRDAAPARAACYGLTQCTGSRGTVR